MSSTELLTPHERRHLLELARASIREGLEFGCPRPVTLSERSEALRQERASFVTLHTASRSLRGCIGTLEAYRPLVRDVSEHAYAAAFRDPRFPPLREAELDRVTLDISVLSVPEPLEVASEVDLLNRLTPAVDGLILEDGPYRSTFLPAVWSSLPEPEIFLRELKRKAGLGPDYWSPTLRVKRYRTESFGEDPI